jgi:hypothetical protein
MKTVNVKWASAAVHADFPSAPPEEFAGLEVPPKCVQLFVVHGVNLTSESAESMDYLGPCAL